MNPLIKKVLILNQSYEPLMVINAKRAVILSITDKVEVLENYSDTISSVNLTMFLPSVIRVRNYVRFKKNTISLSRKNIFKRDNNTCQYCGNNNGLMTIDHIVPKNKGGRDLWENLVTACSNCNTSKGNKLLKDSELNLLRQPKKPSILFHLQKYVTSYQEAWKPYLFMQ